jgi:hypothetical protein
MTDAERGRFFNPAESRCATFSLMDLHRLAEERSIAYHGAIAQKIGREPEIL